MAKSGSIVITQGTQEIANNRTYITVEGKITTSGESWRGDSRTGTYSIYQGATLISSGSFTHGAPSNSTTTLFSVGLWVNHDANGNSGTITASYNYDSGWCTGSGSKTLTTIPRKSELSVANGTLGTAQTLTVTRKSTSFTHTITYACGSTSGTICTKSTTTSISFTPPLSLASQNITGTTVSITYTITTYNGNTSIGSNTYTKTCSIPASVKPSVTLTVQEAADLQWGVYVQDISKLNIVVTPTIAYGSEISSYRTTVGSNTYTASSFTTGILTTSGDLTITTTVTDKRGRTATATNTINIIEYNNPVFNSFKVSRCNADGSENMQGEYGKISFDCSCSGLNGQNEVYFDIEYKKTSENKYTLHDTVDYGAIDGSTGVLTSIFPANSGASYNIRIVAHDAFKTTPQVTVLSTGFSIMHWLSNGLGMAIGKVAELVGVLDIGFKTRFMGGILLPELADKTDLDTLKTTNIYRFSSSNEYINSPESEVGGTLEVTGSNAETSIIQRFSVCSKTEPRVYERSFYSDSWGKWICVSRVNGKLLWEGAWYMQASHTITLPEAISKQQHGIVVVFSKFSGGTEQNSNFNSYFIPKMLVSKQASTTHSFTMIDAKFNGSGTCNKTLYISDTTIKGSDDNVAYGTGANTIVYDNRGYVLRYVIGV